MTDDSISRKTTIEWLNKMFCEPCKEKKNLYNGVVCRACLIDDAIGAIETVPSAQQWIPCSERLPDTGKIVLVCGKMGGIYTAIYSKQRADWDNGWWKLNSKSHRCDPKAWMPLPEPYGYCSEAKRKEK